MRTLNYHPRVPSEAREILAYYEDISPSLGDRFWADLTAALEYARCHPERHHFDLIGAGLRRSNLKDFPIHFLFRVFPDYVRITVIRHDKRKPSYGSRRN
jgi:plasmid stabilization system protein ParE